MTNRNLVRALLASASLAVVAAAHPACAQTATPNNNNASTTVGEVVVTAQKRVERVQDVPVAVTVVNSAQLARQNIQQVGDLAKAVPSLEFQDLPGQGGGPAIRGIGTQAVSITAENSVALVLDGVVLGRQPLNDLFDISRVEVLRGPQGMLFGKNASAGVINITTNAPDFDHYEAIVHADVGTSLGYGVYQGVVNLPLADNAAIRIAAHGNTESGLVDNVTLGKDSSNDDAGARAHLLWDPTSNVTVNIIADYDRNKTGGEFLQWDYVSPTATSLAGILAGCGVTASRGNRDVCANDPTYYETETYGVSGQVDWRIGDYTLTSITANRVSPSVSQQDVDVTPVNFLESEGSGWTGTTSEELRLTSPAKQRLEYVVGLYYSDVQANSSTSGTSTPFPFIDSAGDSKADLTSYAVFGQATFHVTDNLRLIAGGRETDDRITTNSVSSVPFPSTTAGNDHVDNFSYRFGVQYDFAKDVMAYATYSKGYKGPQVNLAGPGIPASLVSPEIPTAYEVGIKGSAFDDRLAVDLNAFYTDVKDFQTQVLYDSALIGPTFVIGNVPDVITKGVELDIFGRPLPGLTINGGATYDDATYGSYQAQNIELAYVNVKGDQLAFAPKFKVNLSAEYAHSLNDKLTGFVQADMVYKSKINFDAAPDPLTTLDNQFVLGARIGVRSPDGRWGLSVFGRNLLDNRYPATLEVGPLSGLDSPPVSVAHVFSIDSFRLIGVSLDGRF